MTAVIELVGRMLELLARCLPLFLAYRAGRHAEEITHVENELAASEAQRQAAEQAAEIALEPALARDDLLARMRAGQL